MTPIYTFISNPNHRLRHRHSRHLRHIAAAGGSRGSKVEDLEFQPRDMRGFYTTWGCLPKNWWEK